MNNLSEEKIDAKIEGFAYFAQILEFEKIFTFLLGIVVLVFIGKILKKSEETLIKNVPSKRLLILQVITISVFLIYIVGTAVLFYGALQPSKELMLALGGSAAVALGLALKDIVSSLVSGLVLLFDQPFQVGDRITFDKNYGEIKSIGLRTVRLKTLDDNIVTIPNSRFLNDVVASGNYGNLDMMVVTDFYVALDADLTKAKQIITETITTSKYAYLKKPIIIVMNEEKLGNVLAINIKAKAYVMDVKYEKEFQTELTQIVKEWFAESAIARPKLNLLSHAA